MVNFDNRKSDSSQHDCKQSGHTPYIRMFGHWFTQPEFLFIRQLSIKYPIVCLTCKVIYEFIDITFKFYLLFFRLFFLKFHFRTLIYFNALEWFDFNRFLHLYFPSFFKITSVVFSYQIQYSIP